MLQPRLLDRARYAICQQGLLCPLLHPSKLQKIFLGVRARLRRVSRPNNLRDPLKVLWPYCLQRLQESSVLQVSPISAQKRKVEKAISGLARGRDSTTRLLRPRKRLPTLAHPSARQKGEQSHDGIPSCFRAEEGQGGVACARGGDKKVRKMKLEWQKVGLHMMQVAAPSEKAGNPTLTAISSRCFPCFGCPNRS